MTKNKLILLSVIIAVLVGLFIYKSSTNQNYNSQVVLAKELHKAMGTMMGDLRQAKTASVKGVPADGRWHTAIAFQSTPSEIIQYHLRGDLNGELRRTSKGSSRLIANHIGILNFKRQPNEPSVLEVRIQARNDATLTSNFKIRMLD